MNKIQAYKLFLFFIDKANNIAELFTIFKEDVDNMSKQQFKTQSNKILNLINKLNLNEIEEVLQILKEHPIYVDYKTKYKSAPEEKFF